MAEERPNIELAFKLADQFGGVANVPEEELAKIGYGRPDPSNLGRILPLERIGLVSPAPRAIIDIQRPASWEEKIQNTPFGETPVPIIKSNTGFRHVSGAFYESLRNKVIELSQIDFPDSHGVTQIVSVRFGELTGLGFTETRLLLEKVLHGTHLRNADDWFQHDEGYITSERAKFLCYLLTLDQGKLTDRTLLRKESTEILNTFFARSKVQFSNFLNAAGSTVLAARVMECSSIDEALNVLADGGKNIAGDLIDKEKAIRQELRVTPKTDIDTLASLNQQLKEIEAVKRFRKAIVEEAVEYYSLPEVIAKFFLMSIKKITDSLTVKKSGSIETTFYLDATPDEEKDNDPGFISGDCTAGNPLPFRDPKIPLYNVKVLDDERKHVGNIYLLATTYKTQPEGQYDVVWHLEAIQIPDATIDHGISIGNIINVLAEKAEEKGVDSITVNANPDLTSNYDFIREAIEGVFGSDDYGEETKIIIPRESRLQGGGEVRILWRNRYESSNQQAFV